MKKSVITGIFILIMSMNLAAESKVIWNELEEDGFGTYFKGSMTMDYAQKTANDSSPYWVRGFTNLKIQFQDYPPCLWWADFDYNGSIVVEKYINPTTTISVTSLSLGYKVRDETTYDTNIPAGAVGLKVKVNINRYDYNRATHNDYTPYYSGEYNIWFDDSAPEIGYTIKPDAADKWYTVGAGADKKNFCKDNITLTGDFNDSLTGVNYKNIRVSKNNIAGGNGTTGPGTLERVVDKENIEYKFWLMAGDNAGNAKGLYATKSGSERFYIDSTAPNKIKYVTPGYVVADPAARFKEITKLTLSWNHAADMPANNCGMQGYYYSLQKYNTDNTHALHGAPLVKKPLVYAAATTPLVSYNFPSEDVKALSYYSFAVFANDNLYNVPENTDDSAWYTQDICTPLIDIAIDKIEYGEPYVTIVDGSKVVQYPVDIYVNQSMKIVSNISWMSIYYYEEISGQTPTYELLKNGGWQSARYTVGDVEKEGIVMHTSLSNDQLTPGKHAHKQYTFVPAVIQLYQDQNGWQVETLGGKKAAPGEVPNLKHYSLQISTPQADNPAFSQEMTAEGCRPQSSAAVAITTNAAVNLMLGNAENLDTGTAWQDYEGDTLSLQMYSINNTALTDIISYSTDAAKAFDLPYQQTIHAYCKVTEYSGTKPVASNNTLHNNATEGFYITFDKTNPLLAGFALKDGERILDSLNTVNHNNIQIGVDKSQLSAGITALRIWNINTDELVSAEYMTEQDIAAHMPDSFSSEQVINLEEYNTGLITKPWSLSGEETASSKRMVAVQFIEGSNAVYRQCTTLLDIEPPAAVTNPGYTLKQDTITLTWQDTVNSNVSYSVKYRKAGSLDFTMISGINGKFRDIDIADMEYNAKIEIQIFAVDKAGNYSQPCPGNNSYYTLYTPAALGNIESANIIQGYSRAGDQYNRYVSWELENSRAAGWQVNVIPAGVCQTEITGQANSTSFKVSGVLPHTAYQFVIRALNANGDISEGMLIYNMKNYAPTAPGLLSPGDFAGSNLIPFKWQAAEDADEETLHYSIKIRKAGAAGYLTMQTITANSYLFSTADISLPELLRDNYFIHNQEYEWYVEAADNSVQVAGAAARFTVDSLKPEISFVNAPAWYSNRDYLDILINPGLSPLNTQRTTYSTSDNKSGSIEDIGLIETGEKAGWFTGRANLHHSNSPYNLTVYAENLAGNKNTATHNNLYIDKEPPVLVMAVPELLSDANHYYSAAEKFLLNLEAEDSFAGVHEIEYALLNDKNAAVGAVETAIVSAAPGNAGLVKIKAGLTTKAVNGAACYLALRVKDWAGNAAGGYRVLDKPIRFDFTAPVVKLNLVGCHAEGGSWYSSDLNQLAVQAEAVDEQSGIKALAYGLCRDEQAAVSWYASWQEAAAGAGSLINGSEYTILAKATNNVGVESISTGITVQYDNSAPVNLGLSYKTAQPCLIGERVAITAQASDVETGVIRYSIAIGDISNITSVSRLIPGNNEGWLEQRDGCFTFVPQAKGVYRLSCAAQNAAGLTVTDTQSYSLVVTDYDEQVLVDAGSPYQTQTDKLNVSWRYTGTLGIRGFKYRVNGPGNEVGVWQPEGENVFTQLTEVSLNNLNLIPGGCYTAEVKAVYYYSQRQDITGTSSCVTIDPSAPQFNAADALVVPAACHAGNFIVSWNITEAESEITDVELLLERAGADNSRELIGTGWIKLGNKAAGSAPVRTDNRGELLNLQDGERIYVKLRATNSAELCTTKGAAVMLYDNSAPPAPVVSDQGQSILKAQANANGLECNWVWTEADAESTTERFAWCPLVFEAGEEPDWDAVKKDTGYLNSLLWRAVPDGSRRVLWTETSALEDGQSCYFLIKAINGAGLESIGISNGIIVDNTGPRIAQVKLLQGYNTNQEDNLYVNHTDNLMLHITASDAESPVSVYHAAYGTMAEGEFDANAQTYTSGTTPIALGTGAETYPALSEGAVTWFSGECINAVGLASEAGYTQGVILDREAPVVEYAESSCTNGELFFAWKGSSACAPVEYYMLELWRVQPGAVEDYKAQLVRNWEHYSGNTLAINTVDTDGSYRLYVKAVSRAGNVSAEVQSARVVRDTTRPQLAITVTTADPLGKYAAAWVNIAYHTTDVPEPDLITRYEYRVGTAQDADLFTDGWVSFYSTQRNPQCLIDLRSFNGLLDGTGLCVSARVTDKAELQSEIAAAEAIIIDTSAAAVNNLMFANSYIASDSALYGIAFDIADSESGILEYRTAVAADKSAAALAALLANTAAWKITAVNREEKTINVSGYSTQADNPLASGSSCYVVVMACNRAGVWSEPLYSSAAVIDYELPGIAFVQGSNGVKKAHEFVFNSTPFAFRYTVDDAVSPAVEVKLNLLYASGEPVRTTDGQPVDLGPGWCTPGTEKSAGYAFNETEYQTYSLVATVTDKAGNSQTVRERLRVNSPPEVSFGSYFDTTPGKPLTLTCAVDDADDAEGDFKYSWVQPDYAFTSSLAAPEITVFQRTPLAQVSVYPLSLQVTDSDGKTSVPFATQIIVNNTVAGMLYADEYWAPEHGIPHKLLGNVTIPAGRTLIIAENAIIEVAADFQTGGYGLLVEGTLLMHNKATLRIESAALLEYWKGIYLADNANAVLNGAIVRNALRGITINPFAEATLINTTFDANQVGIHNLKPAQAVSGCVIQNSYYYGIKEEAGAAAMLEGNWFNGNYIDYYDAKMTALNMDELNALERN